MWDNVHLWSSLEKHTSLDQKRLLNRRYEAIPGISCQPLSRLDTKGVRRPCTIFSRRFASVISDASVL